MPDNPMPIFSLWKIVFGVMKRTAQRWKAKTQYVRNFCVQLFFRSKNLVISRKSVFPLAVLCFPLLPYKEKPRKTKEN